ELDEEEHVDPPQGDGLDGEEVAGDHALRLAADELTPGKPASPSRGAEPRLAQELSHARRRDPEPKPGELAGDPPIAPAGVLARQPQDELADLVADPRTARSPAPVGPAACHQPAVPAQER